jgi:hypothetical protein
MKAIWKYVLETTDYQEIKMPLGAEILTVQIQHGMPCIWCLVDPKLGEALIKPKKIWIHDTGHAITNIEDKLYVGSYQSDVGNLIFHVFDGGYIL